MLATIFCSGDKSSCIKVDCFEIVHSLKKMQWYGNIILDKYLLLVVWTFTSEIIHIDSSLGALWPVTIP